MIYLESKIILILIFINPVTSTMLKYYDKTKSQYSKDVDHLVSINKNGLWIKENLKDKQRIISALKPEGTNLVDVSIFHFDNDSNIVEKINKSFLSSSIIIGINKIFFSTGIEGKILFFSKKLKTFFLLNDTPKFT